MQQAVLLIPGLKEQAVKDDYPELKPGGHWKPAHCRSRYKVCSLSLQLMINFKNDSYCNVVFRLL